MEAVAENKENKIWFKRLKKPGKQVFWVWITYQTVKGILTTSLIWAPLIWAWLH